MWHISLNLVYFFKQNVEATVNLRYITSRTILKTSKGTVIAESGQVTMSLQVTDERWKDRFNQWDPTSQIFTEVSIQTVF